MPSEAVVDNRLFISLNLTPAPRVNAQFRDNPNNRAHLANQLLIYDRIVIPTKDYGIVPILAGWLGINDFLDALETNTFGFVHQSAMLGYAGNGAGIVSFVIGPSETREFKWWQQAVYSDASTAIDLQLKHLNLSSKIRSRLLALVMKNSQSIDLTSSSFDKLVVHESYIDILSSSELKSYIARLSGDPRKVDLTRLPGIDPNELKVFQYGLFKEPVDVVLHIAAINLSILMATQADGHDLYAPDGAERLLKAKILHSNVGLRSLINFVRLLDLNNLPDPGAAIVSGEITLSDIWRIRKGKDARRFREWLRSANADDARELERLYVSSLGEKNFVDSLPIRLLRFAVTIAAGAFSPIAGLGVDVVDSFFVDRWLKGYTPKILLDQLHNLYGAR